MSHADRVFKGVVPSAAFDIPQSTNGTAVTWRQGSGAHESANAPTLSGTWANTGGAWDTAGYYKDCLGRVCLKGNVSGGVAGTAIFTLPTGYRPNKDKAFAIDANGSHCQLVITSAGVVTPAAAGGNTNISLEGVSFDLP